MRGLSTATDKHASMHDSSLQQSGLAFLGIGLGQVIAASSTPFWSRSVSEKRADILCALLIDSSRPTECINVNLPKMAARLLLRLGC
jgi:hypothetical protein